MNDNQLAQFYLRTKKELSTSTFNRQLFDTIVAEVRKAASKEPMEPIEPIEPIYYWTPTRQQKKEKNNPLWILVEIPILLAIVPVYLMLYGVELFLCHLERIIYDEGRLQSSFVLMALIGGFTATYGLLQHAMLTPFLSLATIMGVSNPMSLVSFVVIALGLMMATLLALTTIMIQQRYNHVIHKNAIDPSDPFRYRIKGVYQGADEITARCAMVELREKMGNNVLPSFPLRFFSNNHTINQVRALREGRINPLVVRPFG